MGYGKHITHQPYARFFSEPSIPGWGRLVRCGTSFQIQIELIICDETTNEKIIIEIEKRTQATVHTHTNPRTKDHLPSYCPAKIIRPAMPRCRAAQQLDILPKVYSSWTGHTSGRFLICLTYLYCKMKKMLQTWFKESVRRMQTCLMKSRCPEYCARLQTHACSQARNCQN